MKIDRGLVFLICLIVFVILLGVGVKQLKSQGHDPKEVLLEACTEQINKLTNEDISNISPTMVPSGGGGAYGYRQLLIFWQSDENNLNIKCIGRGEFDPRTRGMIDKIGMIDKLIVNDEDLTSLIRREERKK